MRKLLLIAGTFVLTACGLKDDLYLPAPQTAAPPAGKQPAATPAPSESSEDEEPAPKPPAGN